MDQLTEPEKQRMQQILDHYTRIRINYYENHPDIIAEKQRRETERRLIEDRIREETQKLNNLRQTAEYTAFLLEYDKLRDERELLNDTMYDSEGEHRVSDDEYDRLYEMYETVDKKMEDIECQRMDFLKSGGVDTEFLEENGKSIYRLFL